MNQRWLGMLLVLAACMLWGTTGTAQQLSGTTLASVWVGALRLVFAALFFGALAVLTQARLMPKGQWANLALAGVCIAGYNLAFFAGVRLVGVALGTVVALVSGPVWAGLIQAATQRHWPQAAWWLGTGLAIVGASLMALRGDSPGLANGPELVTGMSLCLLAGLTYAGYSVAVQRATAHMPPVAVMLWAFGLAMLVALLWAVVQSGAPQLEIKDWAVVAYLGVFSAGVSYLLYGYALQRINVPTAVSLALFEPVVACLLAAFVLKEALSLQAWVGVACVLAGVGVVMRGQAKTI